MIISNLIFGIIGVAIGYALVRYAYVITNNFSSIGWVESFIGPGRTVDFYRILGFLIILLSLLLSVGLLLPALRGTIQLITHFLGIK